jgi:nucleotide-binding universal stress UspA family protein
LFTKILAGVDGSRFAEKALEYAVNLAKTYHAKLIVAHVVLRPFYGAAGLGAGSLGTTVYVKDIEAEGKKSLSIAVSNVKAKGIDCESRLLRGDPAVEILKVAESENVDLIVLGSRGLGRVRALLLGGVSDKVSAHSKCPTLIVK